MNILHLFLILSSFLLCIAARFEPYVVLGVHRRASPQEIKTAYKKMVKEWHPDKNGAPEAQQTFMQITR
jgi:DnaJ-class molecular chaperone